MAVRLVRLVILAAILGAMAAAGCASVVTVSPSSMGDWSVCLNTVLAEYTHYKFTKGGPAPAEGNPIPTGNGAFYATLSWADPPDNVWLGLDRQNDQSLAGIVLDQITKLEYVVYNGGMWIYDYSSNPNRRRHSPQPFQLTLTVQCPTTGERRQFWYRPWGLVGDQHWNNRRAWLTLDAIHMQSSPNFASSVPVWYEAPTGAGTGRSFASWDQMLNYDPGGGLPIYAYWELVPTSTYYDPTHADPLGWKSPGWDNGSTPPGAHTTTGTGKCVNLWVGHRGGSGIPGVATPLESYGFKGYVDSFTLEVNYAAWPAEDFVETTYDFASDDPAPIEVAVCDTGKSRWDANPPWNHPYCEYTPTLMPRWLQHLGYWETQYSRLYRWFGQVIDCTSYDQSHGTQYGPGVDKDTHEFYFTIWDGTYATVSEALDDFRHKATVNVRWPWQDSPAYGSDPSTWPVQVGDWVSVMGYLFDSGFVGWKMFPPAEITGGPATLQKYVP